MSVYKRFVSYMFRYENGIKKDSAGYARIENYGEECRIQIRIKDMIKREQKASVYLFYRENDKMQGIFMKEMTISEGVGECKITTGSKNIGDSGWDFEKIGGVIVYITANRFWGTEWDDKPIYRFEPEVPEQRKQETVMLRKEQEIHFAEELSDSKEMEAVSEDKDELKEILSEGNKIEVKAAVLEQDEEFCEAEKHYYEKEQDCFSAYTKVYPFCEADKECIGITMGQLCEVSPLLAEWKDNIFVQYGYVRFRHILLLRKMGEEKECFIGVPGMYNRDEEQMAATYGFEKFLPVRKEYAEHGDFGYWCAKVDV